MVDAVIPLPNNHGEASDEALLLAYRTRHDRGAAGELIRRYERPLYGYLLRYTGNPGLAEELFQTTFQRVIERADQFAAERKFRPWLYSIATHLAIDAGRRSGRSRLGREGAARLARHRRRQPRDPGGRGPLQGGHPSGAG